LPPPLRPLYAGEEVLVDIRPHWVYLSGPLVTSAVVIAVAVSFEVGFPHGARAWHWVEGIAAAVPLLWLLIRFLRWRVTSLVVTSFRVVERFGVWSRRQSEIRLSAIEAVDVRQTLVRRLLGTGDLRFILRDDDQVQVIGDVRKPVILQRIINRRRPPLPGFRPVPR
jgi:uncharacterized membrane protein YdbT with pleckstrin-like domain